jgi:hypothetical protein
MKSIYKKQAVAAFSKTAGRNKGLKMKVQIHRKYLPLVW